LSSEREKAESHYTLSPHKTSEMKGTPLCPPPLFSIPAYLETFSFLSSAVVAFPRRGESLAREADKGGFLRNPATQIPTSYKSVMCQINLSRRMRVSFRGIKKSPEISSCRVLPPVLHVPA